MSMSIYQAFRRLFFAGHSQRKTRKFALGRRSFCELLELEDRTVPAVVLSGTAGADDFLVKLNDGDPTFLETYQNSVLIDSRDYSTTDALLIFGLGGDDNLTVDFTNGNPIPVEGISFDGGAAGSDGLIVIGDGASTAIYTPSDSTMGEGVVTVLPGGVITFTGLEPVDITGFAVVSVASPPFPGTPLAGNNSLTISNGVDFFSSSIDALVITGTTNGGTPIEALALWNNTTILIDTSGTPGDDTITIASADNGHGNTNLTITTGAEANDLIVVNGLTTFSGLTTLDAATINLNANITNAVTGTTATLVNVDDAPSGQVQDGVDVVASGETVNVLAGTYVENVSIAKPLTLMGPNAAISAVNGLRFGEAVIDGGFGDAVTISTLGSVAVQGFTLLGNSGVISSTAELEVSNNFITPFFGYGAFVSSASAVEMVGNEITALANGAFISSVTGDVTIQGNNFLGDLGTFGLEIFDVDGELLVGGSALGEGNLFAGAPGGPVFSWVVGLNVANVPDATIEGNTFTDILRGIWVQNSGLALNRADVSDNVLTATLPFDGGIVLDGATFASAAGNTVTGFQWGVYSQLGADSSIQQNFINLNVEGIRVDDAGPVVVLDNNLAGNTALAINNTGGSTVDASGNWFGTTNEALVLAATSGPVDFTPYLASGTDTSPTIGFQGDFSKLYVTTLGLQVGASPRIQEGYNLLVGSAPLTLYVLSGIYTGNADFSAATDKAVTVTTGPSGGGAGRVGLVGNFTLSSNDSFPIDINGPSAVAPIEYDNWVVTGTVTLGDADLPPLTGSYVPLPSEIFTIIDNDTVIDPVNGIFLGKPGGTAVLPIPFNTQTLKIFYIGNDGNDVILANATISTMYVDDNWSMLAPGTFIADADLGRIGNQPAIYGLDAFASIGAGYPFLTLDGTIIVNSGVYPEIASITDTQVLEVTGPDVAGTVEIGGLSSTINTVIEIYSTGSLTLGSLGGTQTIAGLINGPLGGSLTKTGTGTLTLSHANTYTGGTTLRQGTLVHADELATGLTTAPIVVNDALTGANATTLRFTTPVINNNLGTVYKPITVASFGTTTTFEFNQGVGYVNASLAISKAITITTTAGGAQDGLVGAISGTGAGAGFTSVTFGNTGGGVFQYTAGYNGASIIANSFLGDVVVSGNITTNNLGGTDVNGIIPDVSSVTVNAGATWTLSNGVETFDALNGGGNFDNDGNDITIGFANGTGSTTGVLSGAGSLTKVGIGTQTLGGTAANTYSGDTTITNGTIILAKSANIEAIAGPGIITIGDGIGGAATAVLQINASEQIDDAIDIALAGADARLFSNLPTGAIETIKPINQLNPIPNDFRGGDVTVGGGVNGGTLAVTGDYIQGAPGDTPGTTTLAGGILRAGAAGINNYDLNTGLLQGFGTITVTKLNNFVTIDPGNSSTAGTITIQGNLDLKTTSIVNLEVAGTTAGLYDRLAVTLNPGIAATPPTTLNPFTNGAVFFRGELNVGALGAYVPNNLDSFDSAMSFVYRLLDTDTPVDPDPIIGATVRQPTDFTTKNLNFGGPGRRYDARFLSSTNQLNALSQASNASGIPAPTLFAAIPSIGAATKLNLTALATDAAPINASVAFSRGSITTNTNTRHQNQLVSITNISGGVITGPIYLEFTITGTGVQLFNKAGMTFSSGGTKAYVVISTTSLAAGASASIQLEWSNPELLPFNYTVNVLGGGLP